MFPKHLFVITSLLTTLPVVFTMPAVADCGSSSSTSSDGYETTIAGEPFSESISRTTSTTRSTTSLSRTGSSSVHSTIPTTSITSHGAIVSVGQPTLPTTVVLNAPTQSTSTPATTRSVDPSTSSSVSSSSSTSDPTTTSSPNQGSAGTGSCSSGTTFCCDGVHDVQTAHSNGLLNGLGIDLDSIIGGVGVRCNPVTVLGASGTSCSRQTACCDHNTFRGDVVLGCDPVNINL